MIFKRTIFFFILINFFYNGFSQITYGKITYERRTNLYKKFKSNGDVKEWLREEDKNKIDVFELYFNDTLSVFKPQESDIVERMSWAHQEFGVTSRPNEGVSAPCSRPFLQTADNK